jgi:large repetitive protein
LSATQWSNFTTIDLVGATNTLSVVANGDISAAGTPTLANITTGNLRGTVGNDAVTLTGAQLDAIIVGGGTIDLGIGALDTINLTSTSAALNTLGAANNNGFAGVEFISAATAAAGVIITVGAQAESFNITGSNSADSLVGGTAADTIIGLAGNDTLVGGAGADSLVGGIGNDTIVGGVGADALSGGGNGDTFNFAAGDSALTISWIQRCFGYFRRGHCREYGRDERHKFDIAIAYEHGRRIAQNRKWICYF